jgi:hypothetical protein
MKKKILLFSSQLKLHYLSILFSSEGELLPFTFKQKTIELEGA